MNDTHTLTERLHDWDSDLAVDRSARLVKNIALTGSDSKNGYRYSESALISAVSMYDHKPVFLDHAADPSRPHDRSTRDLVGSVVNPRYEGGRIRGDIRVLDTESGRHFLALAASDTPGVGMSHVVLARRSTDGKTVEQIQAVVSVDAVINPATTSTFQESVNQSCDSPTAVTPETPTGATTELSATPFDLNKSPASLELAEKLDTESHRQLQLSIEKLTSERDSLLARLADIEQQGVQQREQEAREQRMEALLSESALPSTAITSFFKEQLRSAPDDISRLQLIDDRRLLVLRTTTSRPTAPERSSSITEQTQSTQLFVDAIKRR